MKSATAASAVPPLASRRPRKEGGGGAPSPAPETTAAADDTGGTPVLGAAPIGADPTALLHHLTDAGSAFAGVAAACLQLTQFAGGQSSAAVEDAASVASSALFHETAYVDAVRAALPALVECLRGHRDRRGRILAGRTLAALARAAYARVRPSPLLVGARDGRLRELEDEVGAEVPAALAAAALEDPDDGVSAVALEALGTMVLSSSDTPGTVLEDELRREVLEMGFARPAPYAPSLRNVVDEDPAVPQMELSLRILDNVLAPRLVALLDRAALYESPLLVGQALPALVACLVHAARSTPALKATLDRATFAKRWTEADAPGLVDAAVQALLLPVLAPAAAPPPRGARVAACQAALRLSQACPHRPWVPEVCRLVLQALRRDLAAAELSDAEQRIGALALLLVAARAVPVRERAGALADAAGAVAALPATTQAPFGVSSPGALVAGHGFQSYRRPARTGLLVELALSLFVDGPEESTEARREALIAFLASASITRIINERNQRLAVIPLFDELLLAFTHVAVEMGRRFPIDMDAGAANITKWLKLAKVVLVTFLPCVTLEQDALYLEERLSLLTAGEACYVRLVQLYLYMVGLVSLDSSVALKLAANACPPHLLWDQLAESSWFSPRGGTVDLNEAEGAMKLVDEYVARELKQGLASHHMRMMLLSLASDAWVEGRVQSIRQHLEAGAPLSLRASSAREIVVALSPKRLIALIYEGHTPPVDADGKKKRDPVKALAKEVVRASVAAIENIALVACSWRRRFGQSQEAKHIVSVAVGILQGKAEETDMNETMKSIVGSLCEVSVARIQTEYQDERDIDPLELFPVSELIDQPVKPKIKPLVSNARPIIPDPEKVLRAHLMQLSRQIVAARTEQCLLSTFTSELVISARPTNWLRLAVPPETEAKDARCLGNFCSPLAAWGTSVAQCSAASDAVAIVATYTPRRYLRYDGEDEYRIAALIKAFHTVPAELPDGIRLDLGISDTPADPNSVASKSFELIVEALDGLDDLSLAQKSRPLISTSVVYLQEIKCGDQLSWEVSLDPRVPILDTMMIPSVVYRKLPVEPIDAGATWTGEALLVQGDASITTGGESKSGEDDFQVKPKNGDTSEVIEMENVVLVCEPLLFSPLISLQPCPLVFFCNCWGDVSTFRLLWFSMPCRACELKVAPAKSPLRIPPTVQKLARISSLKWDGEAIPGGFATALWAFMTLHGSRVLCCMVENDKNTPGLALHFRGDDKEELLALLSSKAARETIVASLCPGFQPLDD